MFDSIILFIDQYAIWMAIMIGIYKVLHIVLYKGLHPGYLVSTYFTIFSGIQVTESKNLRQRHRFRQVHNVLTILFYSILLIWGIIHLILSGV